MSMTQLSILNSVWATRVNFFQNSICPNFSILTLSTAHDSIIHIFDINLLQEKYFNLKKFIQNPQPEKEIKGRYYPTKLYFYDNLNMLNDSTFVGKSLDMNYGSFFIYNSRSKEKKWIKFNHKFRYPDKKYEDQSYLNSICVHPQKKKNHSSLSLF